MRTNKDSSDNGKTTDRRCMYVYHYFLCFVAFSTLTIENIKNRFVQVKWFVCIVGCFLFYFIFVAINSSKAAFIIFPTAKTITNVHIVHEYCDHWNMYRHSEQLRNDMLICKIYCSSGAWFFLISESSCVFVCRVHVCVVFFKLKFFFLCYSLAELF